LGRVRTKERSNCVSSQKRRTVKALGWGVKKPNKCGNDKAEGGRKKRREEKNKLGLFFGEMQGNINGKCPDQKGLAGEVTGGARITWAVNQKNSSSLRPTTEDSRKGRGPEKRKTSKVLE